MDLCHLPLVTIDGETARDFDDAVYCERDGKGYKLFVAIADVSHYVTHGDPLDQGGVRTGGIRFIFPGELSRCCPKCSQTGCVR